MKHSSLNAISFQERAGKPGGGKGILIQDERIGALSTLNNQSVCYRKDQRMDEQYHAIVRRLTPLECTRLQNFPDGWVDIGEWTDSKGKVHKDSDSPKYKALGNSIALPFWKRLAERISDEMEKEGEDEPTMASLFDGIGGFPLSFSLAGIKPVWASEIEEFPIAVTKLRFPDEEGEENV